MATEAATATGMVDAFLGKADLVLGIGSTFYASLMACPVPGGKVMSQCTDDQRDLNNGACPGLRYSGQP